MGENIRQLRKERGWSQEELGEHAALSYKFVGEIERGVVNPSLDSLLSIANALTIEIAKLFLTERLAILTNAEISDIQSAMAALNNVFASAEGKLACPPGTRQA